MGCRLPKLHKAEEKRSPGNIYSTLRRPQVEMKVGVAYTYHFLDFLLGKEEVPVSSVLCLSSVRELPVQVRELYAQGFVLVAVHPFVHPCGPRHAHIQRQLHRAVLVRETLSSEKSQLRWTRHRLETDVCVAGDQAADPQAIQSYVKRIQDVAEEGVTFVGFLQQPGGAPCYLGSLDPDELSSLHSSPSPIHRHPFSTNTSPIDPTEPHHNDTESDCHPFEELDRESAAHNTQHHRPLLPSEPDFSPLKPIQTSELDPEESNERIHTSQISLKESVESLNQPRDHRNGGADTARGCLPQSPVEGNRWCPGAGSLPELEEPLNLKQRQRHGSAEDSWLHCSGRDLSKEKKLNSCCADDHSRMRTHNNNHIRLRNAEKHANESSPPAQARMQLFALYNCTGELNTDLRFYSLRVPLQIQREAGLITDVDAHWLDYMTQHFSSGAQLIDGFFHLRDENDNGVSSVDSVFIFHNSAEESANTSYDAIVVEQWTIVDGVVVKADYIPLLQSLAPYGWRLMCVLPTPIVKTNSDGSLSTKQILFLQRPVLQRKRKDFKKLNLRGRSKAKKASHGETPEDRENRSPLMETEMDTLRRHLQEQEEEGEGRKSWDGRKTEGAFHLLSPQNDEEESDGEHQTFLSGSRFSAEEQEGETDVDSILTSKPEKLVKWTHVCQRDTGGIKDEVKTEEPIKQQLFSGVC